MSGKKEKASKKKQDIEIEAKTEKVPFSAWFFRRVEEGKLQSWQEKEISVFFKSKGLSDNEESDKYSELLKLY
jgi:UPF0288 family protein (methanogenesis marker protein 3)